MDKISDALREVANRLDEDFQGSVIFAIRRLAYLLHLISSGKLDVEIRDGE